MTRWLVLLSTFALTSPLAAQTDIEWKIRREAKEHSRILPTVHMLAHAGGSLRSSAHRLAGSPNLEAARQWAVERMTECGFDNAHMEPWDFGHPGWANERLTAHIVTPVKDVLTAEVLAWTPGTDGVIRAGIVQIDRPRLPTQDELDIYLSTVADKVAGKIVFVGEHKIVPVAFDAPTMRRDDAQVLSQYDPVEPVPSRRRRREPRDDGKLDQRAVNKAIAQFLVDNGGVVQVNDAARSHGERSMACSSIG